MLVQIVHDPPNPGRNGAIEEVEDGVARLMIRDGLATLPPTYTYPTAPAVTPEPGPVTRTAARRTSERKAADVG